MESKGKKSAFYRGSLYSAVMVMLFALAGFITLATAEIDVKGAKGYISNITLYSTNGTTVNAGPVVGTADVSGNTVTVKISGIPAGSYNRVMVKMAGYPGSSDADLNKYNSFVIKGTFNGKDLDYRSNKTITKDFRFNSPVTVGNDGVLTVSGNVNLDEAFESNGKMLDPENAANYKQIGKNLGKMFKIAFDIQ